MHTRFARPVSQLRAPSMGAAYWRDHNYGTLCNFELATLWMRLALPGRLQAPSMGAVYWRVHNYGPLCTFELATVDEIGVAVS